ncbi:MAG: long-chain fatty acid--CoA ligase [Desulfobacteraceae bacterium]|jgi:long-chain acyl-CoA synthetase
MYCYDKPDNLAELAQESFSQYAHRPLFGTPDADGNYTWSTYGEVGARVDAVRGGLAQIGITSGDAVGIIANNRAEWAITAFATYGLGGCFIPMYEKELVKTWKYIIRDSGIKVLFVANMQIYSEVESFRSDVPCLEHIYLIEGSDETNMNDIEEKGDQHPVAAIYPKPEDIAILIYTSGTTGNPKGVMLSHGNLTSNALSGGALFPEISSESCSLSILPWAHAYGLTAELHNFIRKGGSIGFVRNITTIAEDMAKVAPTFLIAVPRIFNKIYDGLWTKINETGGVAKKLFTMGLESAAQNRSMAEQGQSALMPKLKHKLADLIVYSKIRKRFGGRLKGALTASAMMNMEVSQFFTDIGLPVFDAYGLTETSPAATLNTRKANKPGSVGRPMDKVRVVIDRSESIGDSQEGEIVVYGPNVMKGYHNNPEETRKVMTDDGGFRTGDLGRLDEDGYLFITGRKKEQYKLQNGKYVFPASLEEEIQLSGWVENVMIYGEGRSHNICLVVPDFAKLSAYAEKKGFDPSPKSLVANPDVQSLISESITKHLKNKFGGYEIPKSFILVEEQFSVENNMLTQTLKLKRRKVIERYQDQIDAAYADTPSEAGCLAAVAKAGA